MCVQSDFILRLLSAEWFIFCVCVRAGGCVQHTRACQSVCESVCENDTCHLKCVFKSSLIDRRPKRAVKPTVLLCLLLEYFIEKTLFLSLSLPHLCFRLVLCISSFFSFISHPLFLLLSLSLSVAHSHTPTLPLNPHLMTIYSSIYTSAKPALSTVINHSSRTHEWLAIIMAALVTSRNTSFSLSCWFCPVTDIHIHLNGRIERGVYCVVMSKSFQMTFCDVSLYTQSGDR